MVGSHKACAVLGATLNTAVLVAPLAALGRPGQALHDPLMAAFLLLANAFYVGEVSAMAYVERRALPSARAIDRRARKLALATGLAVLAICWAAVLERATADLRVGWWQPPGAASMLTGILLRGRAIQQLRERFVTSVSVCAGPPLVQEGLYARLRHPSESGLLLFALGAAMLLGSGVAALLFGAILLPLVLVRIRIEDGCLLDAFGHEFESYRRNVPALVPFLI